MSKSSPCITAVARLQTFLDRELSEVEIDSIHFHLGKCPPCKNLFRFEEHLRRLVRVRACTDPAPDSLRVQILAKLREKVG